LLKRGEPDFLIAAKIPVADGASTSSTETPPVRIRRPKPVYLVKCTLPIMVTYRSCDWKH